MRKAEYRLIAKRPNWDTNRGVVEKMPGETGLGAACETAERKYSLINWRIFEGASEKNLQTADADFVDQLMEVEYRRHVIPAADSVLELKAKCDEVAGKFKESRTIPSSSRLHVEKMAKAAGEFSGQLRISVEDETWMPTTMRRHDRMTLLDVIYT